MVAINPVVHSDPEILDGTPVFMGTRVPFQNLMDYLEAGDRLDDELLGRLRTLLRTELSPRRIAKCNHEIHARRLGTGELVPRLAAQMGDVMP